MLKLIIGNKRYSSWSIRPWFFMKHSAIPFEEIVIPLYQEDSAEKIRKWSEAGKVPLLVLEDGTRVSDSLAIGETLAELYPNAGVWPSNQSVRARARSACAEMHSSFLEMRRVLTHNVMRRYAPEGWRQMAGGQSAERAVERDVTRICALLTSLLAASEGPFLGGAQFGFVDAFFVPVVARFATYGIATEEPLRAYVAHIEALPTYQLWRSEAAAEPWRIDAWEYPIADRNSSI